MSMTFSKRRLLLGAGAGLLLLAAIGVAARVYLAGLAIGAGLEAIGASEVKFNVTRASLVRLVVENIGFKVREQSFAAGQISVTRSQWWRPTLGALQVRQARVPVNLDTLAAPNPEKKSPTIPAVKLPFEKISFDGRLVIQAGGLPDQDLMVSFQAQQAGPDIWQGSGYVTGPGLSLKADVQYEKQELAVQLPEMTLDLKPWMGFVQHWVPLPLEGWDVEGKFSGSGQGRVTGDKFTASGKLQLREGRVAQAAKAITAEGVEADLEFTDFTQVTTKPGTLRLRELRVGKVTAHDLAAEIALEGTDRIAVARVSLQALGGTLAAEPFHYVPSQSALAAVLLVKGISIEEVMALTEDLPAQAKGRVEGRIPLRIDTAGFRFGTGWLALEPGTPAEIKFNSSGLLTQGVTPGNARYAVLQKIESGLFKLKISELRLDIRPTDAPANRSARLHLVGAPVDPEVKAPVTLDLNVNGPLESLLNMGLNSQLSFGSAK
jgi:hypothetical protein